MNEKLKELAEIAEQFADNTMNSDKEKYHRPGVTRVWRELMQEKFAELIIKECAVFASHSMDKEAMKQHFGFE